MLTKRSDEDDDDGDFENVCDDNNIAMFIQHVLVLYSIYILI